MSNDAMLRTKINFLAIVTVENANPNGDPLNGNRPRQHYDNVGFMTPVCIKRKLRNRLQDMGRKILVQQNDRSDDNLNNLSARLNAVDGIHKAIGEKNGNETIARLACETFEDVRAFGATLALKGKKGKKLDNDEDKKGVSVGIRGPVTIQQAMSVGPVDIDSNQITKSTNNEAEEGKGADTMGMMHTVRYGVYLIKGSINPILAGKTGFTDDDAKDIKDAIRTLFVNDDSSARPAGSMNVIKTFWWEQPADDIRYSDKRIFDTIKVSLKNPDLAPSGENDFSIEENDLPGLTPEVLEEF